MSRTVNPCRENRKCLCLLAAGALPPEERPEAESHIAACADCRKYYDGIRHVTVPLAGWEQNFAQVETSRTALARWEKDFAAATAPAPPARFAVIITMLDWVHDMIWPCRRIWAGFAAVWLVIIGINFSTRDSYQTVAGGSSRPSPELVRAYLEAEGFLAGWTRPDRSQAAEPPKPSLPQPRSEHQQQGARG